MGTEPELSVAMIMVLGVLGCTIVLFVTELLRVDVAALCVMVTLGLLGLVPPERLFDGFASNAVIAIIAVMIIGAGLDRTGAMGEVAGAILRVGGNRESRLVPLVSSSAGLLSAFMQNVGATALFLPVVSRIASRTRLPLQRLMMPMGFCAIVGGTLTLVGSSPLILLNDLIETSNRSLAAGVEPTRTFSLFSVTPIGLTLLGAAVVYFWLFGHRLLPIKGTQAAVPGGAKKYFAEVYGIHGEIYELLVTSESPLVGMTVGEIEASTEAPFVLAQRTEDDTHLAPPADEMVYTGNVIGVMGPREQVEAYARANALRMQPRLRNFGRLVNPARAGIAEVVIPPGSRFVDRTIGRERLRKRYGLNVLAINRGGHIIRDSIREIKMQMGDSLVIHSTWKDLSNAAEDRNFVVVTDYPKQESRPHKVVHALTMFCLALVLVLFTDLELSIALLAGAVGMVVLGVLSIDEAYEAVSWKTVFLLASLIPLGYAMERTGTAAWIAQLAVSHLREVHPLGVQATLALLATFFTLVMSNVGATVLLVPLAINLAHRLAIDPASLALLVALASSNAFILPTHQVNALIMGPGGYQVRDFLRAGAPMTLLYLIVLLLAINLY